MCRYMHMGLRTGHAKYDMIDAVLEEVGEVKCECCNDYKVYLCWGNWTVFQSILASMKLKLHVSK